jgi:hypothetical protein
LRDLARRRPWLLAAAVYAFASLVLFVRPVLGSPRVECICYGGANPDPTIFMWGLTWWPHSLSFGNPFISDQVFYPHGVDLAHTTVVPGPALVLAPLTAAFGPVFSYNVAIGLVPVLAALATYLLCFELTERFLPSLFGGWLFGFSTYELAQMTGHLHLALVFCVPLLAWLVVRHLRGRLSSRWFVGLSAATLLAQLSISTEVFATLTGFGLVALGVAWAALSESRDLLRLAAKRLAAAYGIALVVASPFLYYALTRGGPRDLSDSSLTTDLLAPFVPTLVNRVGGRHFYDITVNFQGGWGEQGAYVGIPALLIVGLWLWGARKGRAVWLASAMLVVTFVASLGSRLYVEGDRSIPLPWTLVDDLPVVSGALPIRFVMYTVLVVAVVVALWLAQSRRRPWVAYAVAIAAVVAVWPSTGQVFWFKRMDIPPLIGDGGWRQLVGRDDVALVLPHTSTGKAMLWQAWTKIGFRMAGGYFGENGADPDAGEPIHPYFQDQRRVYADVALQPLRDYLRTHRVTIVMVDPIQAGPWPTYLARLGWRRADLAGLQLYRRGTG